MNSHERSNSKSRKGKRTSNLAGTNNNQKVSNLLRQLQTASSDEEKAQIVDRLPSNIRNQLVIRSMHFVGPLPPPEQLGEYEKVLPGAADRIIKMAEDQATHRQKIESLVVKSNSRDSLLGIICAFILGLTVIGGGIYLALQGHSYGSWLSIGGFVGLAGVFVYGTNSNRKERIEKDKARKK